MSFPKSQLCKAKKEKDDVSGYVDVHLPTCVDAIQDMVIEHKARFPGCHGRLITATNLTTKWGVSAIVQLKCNKCRLFPATEDCFPKFHIGERA